MSSEPSSNEVQGLRQQLASQRQALLASLLVSAWMVEARDPYTGGHLWRVARMAHALALASGSTPREASRIAMAGFLHDLGKVGIPDAILLKPGQLDPHELTIMRRHARAGLELVDQLLGNFGLAAVSQVQMLRNIILHHHELVDGSGYPDGLIAEQIPLESRIVTVADVFDALTSERPYKQPWPNAEAFAFLRQQAGLKFDRDCVMALLAQAEDIEHIQQCFRENAYG